VKILLIEDDRETAGHIVHGLESQGHSVEQVHDGIEGLAQARAGEHSALIVDRMLPGMDGLSLVKQLRTEGRQTPVLFLTTMSGLDDRVAGLEGGGDDYLVKPFAFSELLARVNAITRRHGESSFSASRMVELALSGIAAHSVRPLRFAIWLALGFAALGLLFVLYAVVSFLFVQHTVAGWSSIVAVIAILGAAQLLVLGIIGEYVGRTLRETRRRPSYIVAETEAAQTKSERRPEPAA